MNLKTHKMNKILLHLGLNPLPFIPNPNTLPSELSRMIGILVGNDVDTLILNSNDLSMAPYFQKSDSVHSFRNSRNLAISLSNKNFNG